MDPVNTLTLSWAGVAELVDATDSKSVDGDIVSVRFRPPVPQLLFFIFQIDFGVNDGLCLVGNLSELFIFC